MRVLLGYAWLLYHSACSVLYLVYSGTFPDIILVHIEFCVGMNNHMHRTSFSSSSTFLFSSLKSYSLRGGGGGGRGGGGRRRRGGGGGRREGGGREGGTSCAIDETTGQCNHLVTLDKFEEEEREQRREGREGREKQRKEEEVEVKE